MADLDTTDGLIRTGTHLVAGGGGAGLVAWLSRFFRAKEQQAVATELALLRRDLEGLSKQLEKHENINERVALLEQSVKALHSRFDDVVRGARRRR